MSALGQILGGHHEFTCGAKTYKVSLINQKVKLAFERKLYQRARDLALAEYEDMLESAVTEEDRANASKAYEDNLQDARDNYESGAYALNGRVGSRSIQNHKGIITLGALCWGVNEDEMMALMKNKTQEVNHLLGVILKESFPDAKGEGE